MTAIQLFFIKEKGRDTKMNKATKLTLAELLRRKEQMIASKKIKKTMDLYIKSIDSVIDVYKRQYRQRCGQQNILHI